MARSASRCRTIVAIRGLDDAGRDAARRARRDLRARSAGDDGLLGPPEETAAAFVDGYLRTGDVGYMDKDGFIFIIDRIKDLINARGFKVYPRKIEEAIHTIRRSAEVTVIGVPDPYRGEAPKAFVKLRKGTPSPPRRCWSPLDQAVADGNPRRHPMFSVTTLPKTLIGKLVEGAEGGVVGPPLGRFNSAAVAVAAAGSAAGPAGPAARPACDKEREAALDLH